MNKEAYIKGFIAAIHKYASLIGLSGAGVVGDIGLTAGEPSDQNLQRRKNTIDRAFATNDNLPSSTSTVSEPPNRSP